MEGSVRPGSAKSGVSEGRTRKTGIAQKGADKAGGTGAQNSSVAARPRQGSGRKVAPLAADTFSAEGPAQGLPRPPKHRAPMLEAGGSSSDRDKVRAAKERLLRLEVQCAPPSVQQFLAELSLSHSLPRESFTSVVAGVPAGVPPAAPPAAPRYRSEAKSGTESRKDRSAAAAAQEPGTEGAAGTAGAPFAGAATVAAAVAITATTVEGKEAFVKGLEEPRKRDSLSAVVTKVARRCGKALSRAGSLSMQSLAQMQDFMFLHPFPLPAYFPRAR